MYCNTLHEPEGLTIFSRPDYQRYKLHDNSYLKPAGLCRFSPLETGQLNHSFQIISDSPRGRSSKCNWFWT